MSTHNLATDECLALLRDASLRPESIAEEMECAGHHPPAPADIVQARALLDELGRAPDAAAQVELARRLALCPEPLALALLRAAGEAQLQETLRGAASGGQKALAKEAKRELQRLKQKGVKVLELAPQGVAVMRPAPEAEAPPCHASSIDAYGERAVWFARPSRVGVEVVQAVISDLRGVVAVDALGLSRKAFREFVKRMPRQAVVTTIEVTREHARALIAEAAEAGARNGFSPAPGYAEALSVLGPVTPGALLPPQLDFGPDGELPHILAGAALFEDALLASWIPEEDALRAFAEKVDAIAQSQLYVDEPQRAAAYERAAAEGAEAYFTPPRRARYARRLAEMARVLAAEGRIDAARTALAVSRHLGQAGAALNPFCAALFAHALAPLQRDRARAAAVVDAPAQPPAPLIAPA